MRVLGKMRLLHARGDSRGQPPFSLINVVYEKMHKFHSENLQKEDTIAESATKIEEPSQEPCLWAAQLFW